MSKPDVDGCKMREHIQAKQGQTLFSCAHTHQKREINQHKLKAKVSRDHWVMRKSSSKSHLSPKFAMAQMVFHGEITLICTWGITNQRDRGLAPAVTPTRTKTTQQLRTHAADHGHVQEGQLRFRGVFRK